jgi:hypothetical protein
MFLSATSIAALGPMNTAIQVPELDSKFATSEVDFDRVDWKTNHLENPGFEDWNNPHAPSGISNSRTNERFTWFATAPWPVSEGIKSLGMQVRAIDPDHASVARATQNQWIYWSNPTNLTLSFDYYIDLIAAPVDSDNFRLEITIIGSGTRKMYYYMAGQNTGLTNNSGQVIFVLSDPLKTWNSFDRNLTEDFFGAFGLYPTQFNTMYWFVHSESNDYTRVFMDDVWLVNSTYFQIGGPGNPGDFEAGGSWTIYGSADPGDISQSNIRQEGDWSLNATVISNGNASSNSFSFDPYKRISALNPDRFTFSWRIQDYQKASQDTYAYLYVSTYNSTESFYIRYMLCYGGSTSPFTPSPDTIIINATGFNSTGSWNLFNRSIWDDVTAYNQSTELFIEGITFQMYSEEKGSRISILFDDASFKSSTLSHMGFESQPSPGSEISAFDTSSYFTVSDTAYTGTKSANLTVADGDSYYGSETLAEWPVNSLTDGFIDVNWRLNEFTNQSNEFVYFELELWSSYIWYVFAMGNGTSFGDGEDTAIIMLPEANSTGSWFNMQRNIYQDYYDAFGSYPNTNVSSFRIIAETTAGGRIEILFDDLFMYTDPAPSLDNIGQLPAFPESSEAVAVTVDVIEPSLDMVVLFYRVDGSTWMSQTMNADIGNAFEGTIPGQSYDSLVEYYVFANDSFSQSSTAMDGTEYFSYTVVDSLSPVLSISSPTNGSTVGGFVPITADVSDSGSGVARVELYVDSVLVANDTTSPYAYTWNTTSESDGDHSVVARAYDNAGNYAQMLHTVTVDNSIPTTTTPPPGDATFLLIAAAGVAGLVGVILLLFVVRPRMKSRDS